MAGGAAHARSEPGFVAGFVAGTARLEKKRDSKKQTGKLGAGDGRYCTTRGAQRQPAGRPNTVRCAAWYARGAPLEQWTARRAVRRASALSRARVSRGALLPPWSGFPVFAIDSRGQKGWNSSTVYAPRAGWGKFIAPVAAVQEVASISFRRRHGCHTTHRYVHGDVETFQAPPARFLSPLVQFCQQIRQRSRVRLPAALCTVQATSALVHQSLSVGVRLLCWYGQYRCRPLLTRIVPPDWLLTLRLSGFRKKDVTPAAFGQASRLCFVDCDVGGFDRLSCEPP